MLAAVELGATTVCLVATNGLDFFRALHNFTATVAAHLNKDTGEIADIEKHSKNATHGYRINQAERFS